MPNWTYNEINITGSEKDLDTFMEKYDVKNFSFNNVIPEPKTIEDCPSECIAKEGDGIEIFSDRPWFNWYSWRWNFWGVKWDLSDFSYERTKNKLTMYFSTPWCNPAPVFRKLETDNPNLNIRFSWEDE